MLRSKLSTITVGIVIGGLVAGGLSYAAIPHSKTKQITACILKAGANKGATRIIDAQRGATCRSTETKIEWSATGANWRGNWSSSASYQPNDVVYYAGSSWRARRATTNDKPNESPSDWSYLARGGADGADGLDGVDGTDGVDGIDGADGADGVNGADGADGADGAPGRLDAPGYASTLFNQSAGNGYLTQTVIGIDGLALIVHVNLNTETLFATHCEDLACTTATTTLLTSDFNNEALGVAIGADGLPVIAHQNNALGLSIIKCSDTACTTSSANEIDNPGSSVAYATSIAIGVDGLPIVAHRNISTAALRVTHCDDIACTAATSNDVDDIAHVVGREPRISIGVDGLAVVAHQNLSNESLRFSRCTTVACSATTDSEIDDPSNQTAYYLDGTVGSDGLPIVAAGTLDNRVRVTHCQDPACSSVTTLDIGAGGRDVSIAIGIDGYPLLAFTDPTGLRVVHCANRFCVPNTRF